MEPVEGTGPVRPTIPEKSVLDALQTASEPLSELVQVGDAIGRAGVVL
jgi:hypothetical protein